MKSFVISVLFLFTSLKSYAAQLGCKIEVNESKVLEQNISTLVNEKQLIGETSSIRAFITEKDSNFFSLEAFLGEYETRVYSEAYLRGPSDSLKLIFWNRNILIGVSCTQDQ